ncbi:hypothetical protein AVTE2539_21930 [Acidovorax sp. SUPP2539]|nr:hypothetical protein AVTE2539_21930 [Acidovorax sp. SUPP2539]
MKEENPPSGRSVEGVGWEAESPADQAACEAERLHAGLLPQGGRTAGSTATGAWADHRHGKKKCEARR